MRVLVVVSAISTLVIAALGTVTSDLTTAGPSAVLSHARSQDESKTGISLPGTTITEATGALQTVTRTLHRVELKLRHWPPPAGSSGPQHHRPTPAHGSPAPKFPKTRPVQWGPKVDYRPAPVEAGQYEPDTFHDARENAIHRRWNMPQGSPAAKHHRPKPTQWGSKGQSKPTPVKPEGYGPESLPGEASSASVHRRWNVPQGSPASKHHRPTRTQWGSKIHPKPTPVKPEGYGPESFLGEASSALVYRRWNAPQGSPASKHRRPKPTFWGSSGHSKPTLVKPDGYGPNFFPEETSPAVIHRRWKNPQGSLAHKPTKAPLGPLSTSSSISASGTISMSSSALPSSACTSVAPGVNDVPASRDNNTGLLFRSSCGTSDAIMAECPYICSRAGGGLFRECSSTNLGGEEPTGSSPPIECTHCLPPCEQSSTTSVSMKILAASSTRLAGTVMSSACSAVDPFVGTIPSTKNNTTGALLRFECGLSFRLAYECPYLCGHNVGEQLGTCCNQDNSDLAPKDEGKSYTCTHCFYPSRKFAAPIISHTPTCTTKDPYNPPCPSSVRYDDSTPPIRYQTACGIQANDIQDCPFLCTAVDKQDQYHCEKEDVGGTMFKPAGTIQCTPSFRVGHTRPCSNQTASTSPSTEFEREAFSASALTERRCTLTSNGYTDELDGMNQASTPQWSPMAPAPDEEFASFLEFGDLQLDFPPFEGLPQDGQSTRPAGGVDATMDTPMENAPGMIDFGMGNLSQQAEQPNSLSLMHGYDGNMGQFFNMQMPTAPYHQSQHPHPHLKTQRQYPPGMVPPTPNSMELSGGIPGYYQQPHVYEHYQRNQRDQMIFTPLVSPAVTPLDTQYRYDLALPGENFSPLTSPALEARNHVNQTSVNGAIRSSDTSDTTSPIDPNLEYNRPSSTSNQAPPRKTRRKTMPTQKNPARSVKQSPAMKPQSRKKQPPSTTIPPKEISGIIEEAQKMAPASITSSIKPVKLPLPYSQDSSETDSISPESLSEVLMPPPATPKSATASRSPALLAKQPASVPTSAPGLSEEPATPASLMRIRRQAGKGAVKQHGPSNLKEQASLAEIDGENGIEDILLPEPATGSKPTLAPINTAEANEEQSTPTMSGQRTPKYATTSAPLTATSSVFPSPQIGTLTSPGGPRSSRRAESKKGGHESKKRTNSSSVQVSPALRPRISPSIKPLLPEGATVSPETSALLLASKSNYQNILEGTHLPGVSYPENLSTNLTSKRTSHKLAEQGRRNRINTALQEIAALLPPSTPFLSSNQGRSPPASGIEENAVLSGDAMLTGTAAQQSNSKASTVELAIEYIKSLQGELRDVKGRLEEAELQLGKRGGEETG